MVEIHELSCPPGFPINESLPKDFNSVSYETLDHGIRLLSLFGHGPLVTKTDIEDVFRIIPIHPSCYRLFGFSWDDHFYHDRYVPMGCVESCHIYERLICALQWFLEVGRGGPCRVAYL